MIMECVRRPFQLSEPWPRMADERDCHKVLLKQQRALMRVMCFPKMVDLVFDVAPAAEEVNGPSSADPDRRNLFRVVGQPGVV
jgi:hypothetical protein